MIRHGFSNYAFNNTTIKPIIKDKMKSNTTSGNYGGIALNGSLTKILDYMIINNFPDVFHTSDKQFAYKTSYSATMCMFMVLETIQHNKTQKERFMLLY